MSASAREASTWVSWRSCQPHYLAQRPLPRLPHDLTDHHCINLRLPTHGGLYAWDFEKDGREINVRVGGQTTFNNTFLMLQAALDGMGFAFVPLDIMQPHIEAGRLVPVLEDWWPAFPGYHLYYANRKQIAPALSLVIEALRWHASKITPRTTRPGSHAP